MNDQTVECEECGRQGTEDFVWFQGEIMLCANKVSCKARRSEVINDTAEAQKAQNILAKIEKQATEMASLCEPGVWPENGGLAEALLADYGRAILTIINKARNNSE